MVEQIRQGDIPGVQLRCRQDLAVSPAEAWEWIATTDRLSRWICDEAVSEDSAPQQSWRLHNTDSADAPPVESLLVLERAAPHRLILALKRLDPDWPVATRLTIDLAANTAGCEISVFQEGFEHLPLSDCLTLWEAYRRRWRHCLTRLAALCG